jgi:hypothetical protein
MVTVYFSRQKVVIKLTVTLIGYQGFMETINYILDRIDIPDTVRQKAVFHLVKVSDICSPPMQIAVDRDEA